MDIKQLWLNVKDLWSALDEHPLLHSSLGLLVLLVALLIGNVALAFTILFAVRAMSALLNVLLDARTEHVRIG